MTYPRRDAALGQQPRWKGNAPISTASALIEMLSAVYDPLPPLKQLPEPF